MKDKKRIKTKIILVNLANAKIGEMEDNTREGRSRSTRKYVVGCVHAVTKKKRFLVKFEYG